MTENATPGSREIIGVVGAGTMGAGIAQVAIEHGHEVVLYDVDEASVGRGLDRIREGLGRRPGKGDPNDAAAVAWIEERLAAVRTVVSLEDVAAQADWVIEAALEDLALKQSVFSTLDAVADPRVGLATNTSALSVGMIAGATRHPERVLGLHFFNPAPVMRLVEVVAAPQTSTLVADAATALVESWGKVPVRTADQPGFIVNRVNRPFTLEALRILEDGRASMERIDLAMERAGFPLGPFEFMDMVGLDVNLAAANAIYGALGAARLRPSAIQQALVDRGRVGRKSGLGFYRYDGVKRSSAEPLWPPLGNDELCDHEIVARIQLAIANEAFHALSEGVATAGDIDRAMQLGANHPDGPIEWAMTLGLDRMRRRLEALVATEGDRFRPAPGIAAAR